MGLFRFRMKPIIDVLSLKMFWERLQWAEPGRSGGTYLEPLDPESPGRRQREYRAKRRKKNKTARMSRAINRRRAK